MGDTPQSLLAMAAASECGLLDWLRPRVSLPVLEEISKNDCGEEIEDHLAGIQAQLATGPPLGMLPWCPREVLELERWAEPDEGVGENAPTGERGHLKRLLACTILLRNGAYVRGEEERYEKEFFLETSAASIAQLGRSAVALEIPLLALGFVVWLLEAQPHPALRPFAAFCALVLAAAAGFGGASDEEIVELCTWVDGVEDESRKVRVDEVESERWLVGVNSYECIGGRKQWRALVRLLLDQHPRAYPQEVRDKLHSFYVRLSEDEHKK